MPFTLGSFRHSRSPRTPRQERREAEEDLLHRLRPWRGSWRTTGSSYCPCFTRLWNSTNFQGYRLHKKTL